MITNVIVNQVVIIILKKVGDFSPCSFKCLVFIENNISTIKAFYRYIHLLGISLRKRCIKEDYET